MMTDYELLELAANAAGYSYDEFQMCWYEGSEMREPSWNPLTDDGDALRLAVKLRLSPCVGNSHIVIHGYARSNLVIDEYDGDPYAATRRAIVRAAAEIWKDMKC